MYPFVPAFSAQSEWRNKNRDTNLQKFVLFYAEYAVSCGPLHLAACSLLSSPSAANQTHMSVTMEESRHCLMPLDNLNVYMYPSLLLYECAYFDLLLFSASFCSASDTFDSWRFLLHKATVSGTLTCHCVRPTTEWTTGLPPAAAPVLHRDTRRRWRLSCCRRQIHSITSMDKGPHLWRKCDDAWTYLITSALET